MVCAFLRSNLNLSSSKQSECNISIYFACILDNELNVSQRTKYQYGENVIKRVCFVKSTQSKCKYVDTYDIDFFQWSLLEKFFLLSEVSGNKVKIFTSFPSRLDGGH